MVAIVIGMGGTSASLGCGKSGIGTARSGGSGPQRVAIPMVMVIRSLGTTNGRGGEQPRRLAEEEVGKKTTFGKWQMNQTQKRLPRRRKTPRYIQMKQKHRRLPSSNKMPTPHVPQSRKGPMPHNPQPRKIPRKMRASASTGRCSMVHTTVMNTHISRCLTTRYLRFQQLRLGMRLRAMHRSTYLSSKLHRC